MPVSEIKLEFLPNDQYYTAKVMLGSQDITDKIVNNVYKIASVSSDMSLSVTFEKIPTYTLNINMTGGTGCIKVEDKTITESDCISDLKKGTMFKLYFQPDNSFCKYNSG
ncbi:hypothetical protein M1P97_05825 [Parabacteroides sp. GYB001]|uniref:hypothetical protein n=1 Tax=Parabacteroides leei TaxID=2939491 RepID=UPI002016FC1F|nr:hypothetical protein [Parabacteroides leei]MCL3850803.1 hypothetical protein [Parabacteroides leei]